MNTDIQIHQPQIRQNFRKDFTSDQIAIIRSQVDEKMTDMQIAYFLEMCAIRGLQPLLRQAYGFIGSGGKVVIMVSMDGLRTMAERTGEYQGFTEPMYYVEKAGVKSWTEIVDTGSEKLIACKIGVRRKGWPEPAYAIAYLTAYSGSGPRWQKDEVNMLTKCAKALCLRDAFPESTAGTYINEELMDQIKGSGYVPKAKPIPLNKRLGAANDLQTVRALWSEYLDGENAVNDNNQPLLTDEQKKNMRAAFSRFFNTFGASWSDEHQDYLTQDEMGVTFEDMPVNQEGEAQ